MRKTDLEFYDDQRQKEDQYWFYRDRDYMKQLYPRRCMAIERCVSDECDRYEYEGSSMFAQYPDKVALDQMAAHIYEGCGGKKACEGCRHSQENNEDEELLEDLIKMMLFDEIAFRRQRYHHRMQR